MFHSFSIKQKKLRITIIGGTGAVGAYFAKQFLTTGHYVSIIGKKNSDSLNYINKNGLTLMTSEGTQNITKTDFHYVGDFENFPKEEKQNLVIISLKQYDMNDEIARKIVEITNDNSLIGVIANGIPFYFLRNQNFNKKFFNCIDSQGKIEKQLGNRQIVGIQPVIASQVISPGIINITRPLTAITVALGTPENNRLEKVEELNMVFNMAGIKTTVTKTLQRNILEKLQFSLSINTLSAIMEKNIGDVFDSKETQPLIAYSIKLINQISNSLGLGELRNYEQFKSIFITKEHFSSLFHDMKKGKFVEVEGIIGTTVELVEFLTHHHINKSHFLDLKPLILLKKLLNQKCNKIEINGEQLIALFESCQLALASEIKNERIKIKAAL